MLIQGRLIFFTYPGDDAIAQTFASVPEMTEDKFNTALRNVRFLTQSHEIFDYL